eukprot:UN00709
MFYKIRAFDRWQSLGLKSISRDYMQGNSHFWFWENAKSKICLGTKFFMKKGIVEIFLSN